MCGIVGYIGEREAAPILIDGLRRLEYRGYDSAGLAVQTERGIVTRKLGGRVEGLATHLGRLPVELELAIPMADRTAARKIQEAYLAIQIERAFTKEQIFTLYGNQIYLGSGMYGFEAASEYYFSKHAKDLTLTESALLAGLPIVATDVGGNREALGGAGVLIEAGDGLQAGNPRANHQNAGRCDCAGRSRKHRENFRQRVRGNHHGFVTAHRAH